MSNDNDRIADLERLQQGVDSLATSESWQDFLRVQSTFHQYSYRNVLLITRQYPQASRVAGFRAWQKLGRTVRRGERAIWILAPSRPRIRDEIAPQRGPSQRFVPVPVFDITQTEGRDLPTICQPLEGGIDEGVFERLERVAARLRYRVDLAELAPGVNGECRFEERRIRIESRNGPSQQVKSLAHELAHVILHRNVQDRPLAELEAESVAFVVCRRFGIDSSAYSFGYVATWAGDAKRASEIIHRSCERIQAAVHQLLESDIMSPAFAKARQVA